VKGCPLRDSLRDQPRQLCSAATAAGKRIGKHIATYRGDQRSMVGPALDTSRLRGVLRRVSGAFRLDGLVVLRYNGPPESHKTLFSQRYSRRSRELGRTP
jgi:hypothetical protein